MSVLRLSQYKIGHKWSSFQVKLNIQDYNARKDPRLRSLYPCDPKLNELSNIVKPRTLSSWRALPGNWSSLRGRLPEQRIWGTLKRNWATWPKGFWLTKDSIMQSISSNTLSSDLSIRTTRLAKRNDVPLSISEDIPRIPLENGYLKLTKYPSSITSLTC